MTARVFEDSAGEVWEVFEVRRGSTFAVSEGLEHGWLAFVSGPMKRRLAPFPPDWTTLPDAELERLCALARHVTPLEGMETLRRVPRVRRMAEDRPGASPSQEPEKMPPGEEGPPEPQREVAEIVRAFAHDARGRRLPAVAAMLELKMLLQERFPDPASPAYDRHFVRRWFVQAYYFERKDSAQSR